MLNLCDRHDDVIRDIGYSVIFYSEQQTTTKYLEIASKNNSKLFRQCYAALCWEFFKNR